jgi:polyhydroxybutyrate depolymerase
MPVRYVRIRPLNKLWIQRIIDLMFPTRLVVWLTLTFVGGLTPAADASPTVMTWSVAGTQRTAIVYAPANAPSVKAPLIFAFHGFGDTNANFQGVGLEEAWPQAIVVYPQGLPVKRGGPALPGWQTEKGGDEDRDLLFVDTALASLRRKFKVDDARVYATGFSNGAVFTYLLWAERPNVFAAFAAVAGRLGTSVLPAVPKPFLQVGGKNDGNIRFALQEQAMETARRVDGVSNGESCGGNCTLYPSANGTPVMTVVHEGGHEWPDGTSQRIAKFFGNYPPAH